MAGWMIDKNDPARDEIVRRAMALGITGNPDRAAHELGEVTLADGRKVMTHVVHAVDPVITDGEDVVMINRLYDPGKGKPALPGGLIDPIQGGGVESAVQASAREAMEEVSISLEGGMPVGERNMNRPFDVRVARFNVDAPGISPEEQEKRQARKDDFKTKYGIEEGDVFMVSTQAVRFEVPDLKATHLDAGDDAEPGSARRVNIGTLTRTDVGIPDHYDMIQEALAARPARRPEDTWAAEVTRPESRQR